MINWLSLRLGRETLPRSNSIQLALGAEAILCGILFLLSVRIPAQEEQQYSVFDQIDWQAGPAMIKLDDLAELNLPEGYLFANGEDTRILMEALGNPPSYTEKGLYGPESLDWFVVFEFDDIGYVNDDEKNDLDADAMLESIREGNEESNKYRRERGFTGLTIIGWIIPFALTDSAKSFNSCSFHTTRA